MQLHRPFRFPAHKDLCANCFREDASRAQGSEKVALPVNATNVAVSRVQRVAWGQVRLGEHLVPVRARLDQLVFLPQNLKVLLNMSLD